MAWAIRQGEPDTVAEILDSLAGCGAADSDPLMIRGRAFLLEQQREDGGWGDENDEYGRFHSVWTCIDGLRDYRWGQGEKARPDSLIWLWGGLPSLPLDTLFN